MCIEWFITKPRSCSISYSILYSIPHKCHPNKYNSFNHILLLHQVLEFFDKEFASRTPFLVNFYSQENQLDLFDADATAITIKARLTFNNFESLDLSGNVLVDVELAKLLRNMWKVDEMELDEKGRCKQRILMKKLVLEAVELGSTSMLVLSRLMEKGFFPKLEHLNLGNNSLNSQGVDYLLNPLRRHCLPLLRELYIPLNNFYAEGLLLITASQTLGTFDTLEIFDMSDCGCNNDALSLFARAVVLKFREGKLVLKKMRIFGMHPYAGKSARVMFPEEFLKKIAIS